MGNKGVCGNLSKRNEKESGIVTGEQNCWCLLRQLITCECVSMHEGYLGHDSGLSPVYNYYKCAYNFGGRCIPEQFKKEYNCFTF